MLAARLVLLTSALATALALSIGGSTALARDPLLQPATPPSALPEPRRARPHIVGRILDVGGEPFVGEITLSARIEFPNGMTTSLHVPTNTDASGAFDFELRSPRIHEPGTDLTWSIAPDDAAPNVDFVLAGKDARRAVGTLTFESGEDGAVIGDIGTVQLLAAPRVASLHIECPVATTHEVVIGESDYENSSDGPFQFPYHAVEVATGTTVDLFSWSTADRWHVFTNPASPRAESLMAVIERDQDLALFSRECFQVCISIDAPPTAQGAQRALFVVMPLRSATTGTRLGPHEEVGIHWISIGMQRRRGPEVYQLALKKRDLELYLPAGLHRFEYWEYEHVLDGPRLSASAPVFVNRSVILR